MAHIPPASTKKLTFREVLSSLNQKPMLLALLMGFISGFPLLIASRTLQSWISYTGGSNTAVAEMALLGLPYTLKFLWAPIFDRFTIGKLGRRRGWMMISQLGVAFSVFSLSRLNPVSDLLLTSVYALGISFFGASQDIVIDAYRRETLKENELGLGSSVSSMGYRAAMWITGGLALILAGYISWNTVYLLLALVMAASLFVTFWAEEPAATYTAPKTMHEAVYLPLADYFKRHGAILILIFILLYKVGDAMAGNMLPKFYQTLGFTPQEVGFIAKSMGPLSVVLGTFLGGVLILKLGIYRALFVFGILQAASTLSFVALDMAGHNLYAFAGVVFFEDFTSGMGSAAFMAFMASLTNTRFTGTQYALLTSLMAVPRTVIASRTGVMVDALGWGGFYVTCAIVAIPGLILIRYVYKLQRQNPPLERAPNV
jgi:MFS transporter, PAT family, beta-lactamase induction signal transducer AmpG